MKYLKEFNTFELNETKKTKKVKKPKKTYNLNIVEKEYTVITNTNKIKKYTITKNRQDETYLFSYNNMEFVTQKNNIDEILKIINEILKYDFELNEIASDIMSLFFRRYIITYENKEYYNNIILRLTDRKIIVFNNNDIIRVNGIDIEEKMKDYFEFTNRIFTDKQLFTYLKSKYKIQETNNNYTIKQEGYTYDFSFVEKEKTDDNVKFLFKLNIDERFYTQLFELDYNLNDIIMKDYSKGHFIYFEILKGVDKIIIDYKMNILIEENIRFMNTLIDNMLEDDKLFHNLKDYLPQNIMNKYLEKIDKNDLLI